MYPMSISKNLIQYNLHLNKVCVKHPVLAIMHVNATREHVVAVFSRLQHT